MFHVSFTSCFNFATFEQISVSACVLYGKEVVQHAHSQSLAEASWACDEGHFAVTVNKSFDKVCLINIIVLFPHLAKIVYAYGHDIILLHNTTPPGNWIHRIILYQ